MPRKPERPLGDEDFDEQGEGWREPVEAETPSEVTQKGDAAHKPEVEEDLDGVDEASRESMDASDPPARSVVTRTGDPKRPSDPRPREPVTR